MWIAAVDHELQNAEREIGDKQCVLRRRQRVFDEFACEFGEQAAEKQEPRPRAEQSI